MKSIQELLEIKNKKKKPVFTRQEYPARIKLGPVWRKPKGIHSKMRDKRKGKKAQPSVGYSAPKLVRGLTKEGLLPIHIQNLNDLNKVTQKHIIILDRTLGLRKRLELLKKIQEKKFRTLNIRNVEKAINEITENFNSRKKAKEENKKSKSQAKKELEKNVKEKPKEEQITEEDKKKQENEEKRKVLEGKK